ncbi:MAG: hypothetical protein Q9171_002753 [Xanthocarpia ochracea]
MDSDSLHVPRKLGLQRASSQHSTSSAFQSLQKKLNIVSLHRSASESATELIGSLGLTLLFEPEEVLADFIFVHGLRGGSRKTWSFSADPAHFWPKEWLPGDPDFKNVRIHTFGYHSNWGESKGSDFNVHDFGQNLIEEIHSSSTIGRSDDVPLVLIGHSMGGLVIKKAVILSRENPAYKTIGDRIHSLYFLATPHRGSDLAKALNNILKMVFKDTKAYVTNLERSSEAQQVISDSFRHYYSGIHLHSFLESIPLNLGYGSALVVDRSSATLGYTEERVQFLNADHRSICKYESPLDPNFQTIRNRLAATVHDITRNAAQGMQQIHREHMRQLSSYLNVSDAPVDDLTALEEQKLEGSCEWLTRKESYLDWQYNKDSRKYFWLRGKPAMGKSMTSSHVVQQLEGTQCSYFFFKHNDRLKSSLAVLLRSMAYQMANSNRSVRQQLIELQQDDPFLEMENARNIWRKVFGVVFKAQYHQPHYWVIDALDECKAAENHDFGGLFGFLAKIDEDVPLKLFITSRFTSELERLIAPLRPITEQITAEDTTQDIRSYVELYLDSLPGESREEQNDLAESIISKSSGCFLWAVVVIQQLKEVMFFEETEDILQQVPQEMEGLYMRSLQVLSTKTKYKHLTLSILNWTVCSMRALTTLELKDALKLDISQTIFKDLEKAIPSLSGHLVSVDRHSRVQTIHQTATSFLTDSNLDSEFRVKKSEGNASLAKACLRYLCGEEMQMQKRRRSSAAIFRDRSNALCDYACSYFSEHLLRATSTDDELLKLLTTFLQTNILTWIEVVAQKERMDFLTRAAKHLKAYLDRRAKSVAPLGGLIRLIDAWATDLPRIAGEFGINLISDPSAIYRLIPPLCPPNSTIYKQFAGEGALLNTFQVRGLSAQNWNDRVSCIYYGDQRAESIACRDGRFAVGFSDGNIIVYYGESGQEAIRLSHGDGVLVMELGSLAGLLAASSRTSLKVWNVGTGGLLFTQKILPGNDPLTLSIDDDGTRLLAATARKDFMVWDIPNGNIVKHQAWAESGGTEAASTLGRPPTVIKIKLEHNLLAVTYRSLPVFLWDLETFTLLGTCNLPTSVQGPSSVQIPITDFVFNPNPDVELLAVAYMASELALYDTFRLTFKASVPSECDILAASSDGRTLAGGDSSGRIQLFDFDTLQVLVSISLPDYGVKAMQFSNDGLRLFDLRDCECNIWEPSALVRKTLDETNSEPSASAIPLPSKVEAIPIEDIPIISALPSSVDGDFVVCGNDHGGVVLYDLYTGRRISELYKHGRNCSIRSVQWNENAGVISTADTASRLQVVKIVKDTAKGWKKSAVLLDERLSEQVMRQQLLSPDATRVLVATSKWILLYDVVKKHRVAELEVHGRWWPWINHPVRRDLVLLFEHSAIRTFKWDNLESAIPAVKFMGHEEYDIDYEHYATSEHGGKLLMKFVSSQPAQPASARKTYHISTLDLSLLGKSTALHFTHYFVDPNTLDIDFIVGITASVFYHGSILLFFTKHGWICSIDIDQPVPQEAYIRHFFVPSHWLSGTESVMARVTRKRDVLVVQRDEIAVFKNALDQSEYVNIR